MQESCRFCDIELFCCSSHLARLCDIVPAAGPPSWTSLGLTPVFGSLFCSSRASHFRPLECQASSASSSCSSCPGCDASSASQHKAWETSSAGMPYNIPDIHSVPSWRNPRLDTPFYDSPWQKRMCGEDKKNDDPSCRSDELEILNPTHACNDVRITE